MVAAMLLCLTACKPIEDFIYPAQKESETSTLFPLSVTQYGAEVRKNLQPIINDTEALLSRHLEVTKGKLAAAEEISAVENSLVTVQNAIESISILNQPKSCTSHKNDTLERLRDFKEALDSYKEALEGGEKDEISTAADLIKTRLTAVQTSFTVYQDAN